MNWAVTKYLKPKSVTWWAAFTPLSAGIFIATEPLHHLGPFVQSVQAMFGGATPQQLILSGLGGIGLRGAISHGDN